MRVFADTLLDQRNLNKLVSSILRLTIRSLSKSNIKLRKHFESFIVNLFALGLQYPAIPSLSLKDKSFS